MIDDKPEEPTPFGTLRYAEDYRVAAEKVIGDCNPLESGLLMPAYNLIGQSIELSLKAYLLSAGLRASSCVISRSGIESMHCLRRLKNLD